MSAQPYEQYHFILRLYHSLHYCSDTKSITPEPISQALLRVAHHAEIVIFVVSSFFCSLNSAPYRVVIAIFVVLFCHFFCLKSVYSVLFIMLES